MNRFNFGNQATNGMQILSVAGTTAAGFENSSRQRKINDLSSGLNNLSEEELRSLGKMRADKLRKQISKHNFGGDDGSGKKPPSDSADEVMDGKELKFEDNSPQVRELQLKMDRDRQWRERREKLYSDEFKGNNRLSTQLRGKIKRAINDKFEGD